MRVMVLVKATEDSDGKWQRALAKLGVDLTMLSTDAGHA